MIRRGGLTLCYEAPRSTHHLDVLPALSAGRESGVLPDSPAPPRLDCAMTDYSNGYERVAIEFLSGRGCAPSTAIGTTEVRNWARTLPHGAAVIDLGCGPGVPITKVLVNEGLKVYAIDAAPSLVAAFRRNLPEVPVSCEPVEDSLFFGRTFDAVLAWGLIFLLQPEAQRSLAGKMAHMLVPGGRLLFTAPSKLTEWNDALTGLSSRSLGAVEYRRLLSEAGIVVDSEYEDVGENHYYNAHKQNDQR